MPDEKPLERIAFLMERQLALQLHFAGARQDVIARILQKRKDWVNELVRGLPADKRQATK